MIYFHRKGTENKPVFMLFHGTGGDEHDLVGIIDTIDPEASIFSFRGDVSENGYLRFFKRIANGIFDQEDLKMRTDNLYNQIEELSKQFSFKISDVILLGYSNGANIIGSLLFSKNLKVKGAVVMHPMSIRKEILEPDLKNVPILVTAGTNDPICTIGESKKLIDQYKTAKAIVNQSWFEFGHSLSNLEIKAVNDWYWDLLKSK